MHTDAGRDVERLQRDLATMREALGAENPFGRAARAAWLGVATVSALGALAAWTGSRAIGATTGAAGLTLAAGVLLWTVRARNRRATAPVTWREVRTVATAKLVGAPMLAAFLLWLRHVGAPLPYILAVAAFCCGLLALIYATTRPWRRIGIGLGLPLIAFGMLVLVLPADRVFLAAGCTGIAAGCACAAILWMERHVWPAGEE